MIKKLSLLFWSMLITSMALAQQPLPLDPDVRHGVLSNGLTYYVLHNEHPKNRANFYIAQKVGSALETPRQYGLAHFLEHMAFNGTKNFPGDALLRYLESKGIRFGADVNAYTDYEETVYNIDNVPTSNVALMDSVLLVLRDWSCDLLLEDDEIDAERKVIQEEWRMRNDPTHRFRVAMAPVIFSEPQYQLTPIGTMDVVMNFPYSELRDYYHKWYRPDQQGIIVVGDFDAEEMEQKVIAAFSDIKMPKNAAPREYAHVSDNIDPLFFAFEDSELKNGRVDFQVKYDMIPLEYRNTDLAFITSLMQQIMADMINTRLYERQQDADCRYANAGVYFGNMYPSKTKGIFNVVAIAKEDEMAAFEDALAIVARACKAGFTQSELERAIANTQARYDRKFNERANTETSVLAQGLLKAFKDNEPAMGISAEREFFNSVINQIPIEAYNQEIANVITPENRIILIQQQKKEGKTLPVKEQSIAIVNNVLDQTYEAYQDQTISEPLIANLPKKGKIVKSESGKFGTTELTLSNGIKVIVKPTGYKDDQILFQAFRKGGKMTYPGEMATNLKLIGDAFSLANFGPFDNKSIIRYLAGKNVSLDFGVGQFSDYLGGSSTVKDLPTLMELINTAFTNLNPNEEVFLNAVNRMIPQLQAAEKSPEYIFELHKSNTTYSGNPMASQLTAEMLSDIDYTSIFLLYHEIMGNPADFTFLFTGSVDVETLSPLLEQYIASLPTSAPEQRDVITPVNTAEGEVTDDFSIEMEAPADWLYGMYTGDNLDNSIGNQVKVGLIGDILSIIYTDILREKEGGVYTPQAFSTYDLNNGKWDVIYFLQTNSEQSARMLQLADELFMNLLKDGATAEQFNRVKEAALSQYENAINTNNYWHDYIRLSNLLETDMITDHREAIENLTLEEFNKFLQNLYDGKNRIQVNMHGI